MICARWMGDVGKALGARQKLREPRNTCPRTAPAARRLPMLARRPPRHRVGWTSPAKRVCSQPAASDAMTLILNPRQIKATLDRLTDEIVASVPANSAVGLVGIRSRGEILAQRLSELMQRRGVDGLDLGVLDITLYRDDLAEKGPAAIVRSTQIHFPIEGRYVILIDDVIYTGRSVRAALTALADLGRATATRLAVLIDRPARELPIQPDFVGLRTQPDVGLVTVKLEEVDGIDAVEVE